MGKFENIKVGDKVIVKYSTYAGESVGYIGVVKKVNKTSFNCVANGRSVTFTFSGNERGGDTWHPWWCEEYSEEGERKVIDQNMRLAILGKLKSYDFSKLPTDSLKEIYKLITSK
jgi:hypothetical protein